MRFGGLSRAAWSVSVPIIFASLGETILHVTDTILLARVGIAEVGAIALADTILEMFVVLTAGLVDGIQILVARRLGEGRDRSVGRTFNQGLLVLAIVSLALTIILGLFAAPLSRLLVSSEGVGAAVEEYLSVIALGILFTSANFAYSALFVGFGKTRVLIGATVVLGISNLALDSVLIFGGFGLPPLGMRGAALGSVGAEIATFLFLTGYVLTRLDVRRYGLLDFRGWDRWVNRSLVRLSSPIALQALLEAIRWFAFFLIVERIGEEALAQSNIVYACFALFRIPTEGFAETSCSMVSRMIGAGQHGRIEHLLREAISAAYLLSLPLAALAFLFPGPLLSLMTSEEPALAAGAASLRVVALAMLIIIPAEMWFVAVTGTGDTYAAAGIEVVLTAAMVGCGYLSALVLGLELEYVWMSVPIAWLACLVLSYSWMRSGYWMRLRI